MRKLKKDYKIRKELKRVEKEKKIYKALIRNELIPLEIRMGIQEEMIKEIKRISRSRIQNYCIETGRSRGVIKKLGRSRITLKEKGEKGELTG
jgi:ribosomal protein S14